MSPRVVKAVATFFGIGYLPWWPGTWASAAGVGLYLCLRSASALVLLIATAALLVAGFLSCGRAEKIFQKKDSRPIVIDEAAAMLVVLFFVAQDMISIGAAFVVFRMMDIVKPYPIKKIEQLSGSWGIMMDDIVAGAYTVVSIRLFSILIGR